MFNDYSEIFEADYAAYLDCLEAEGEFLEGLEGEE